MSFVPVIPSTYVGFKTDTLLPSVAPDIVTDGGDHIAAITFDGVLEEVDIPIYRYHGYIKVDGADILLHLGVRTFIGIT